MGPVRTPVVRIPPQARGKTRSVCRLPLQRCRRLAIILQPRFPLLRHGRSPTSPKILIPVRLSALLRAIKERDFFGETVSRTLFIQSERCAVPLTGVLETEARLCQKDRRVQGTRRKESGRRMEGLERCRRVSRLVWGVFTTRLRLFWEDTLCCGAQRRRDQRERLLAASNGRRRKVPPPPTVAAKGP